MAAGPQLSRQMLVSQARDLWADIDVQRVRSGRFLTEDAAWLAPQVAAFIAGSGQRRALDPFAGDRHLLEHVLAAGLVDEVHGIDIDASAAGGANAAGDSLAAIEGFDGIVVTNPPYLARHSARRKRVYADVAHWFDACAWFDLYQLALERMLGASGHVVALLPETFLHTRTFRERLAQVTVLERRHPFAQTQFPALVACFGPEPVVAADAQVWVDDAHLGSIAELDAARMPAFERPAGLRFNDPAGRIGLRAVDGRSGAGARIAFLPGSELDYDPASITRSSRLVTRIGIPDEVADGDLVDVCERANARLDELRRGVGELALSPFKGNDRDGRRRRRIDYRQAARILAEVLPPAVTHTA